MTVENGKVSLLKNKITLSEAGLFNSDGVEK